MLTDGSTFMEIEVHGGVTWSEWGDGDRRRHHYDDDGKRLFWIGFSCGHSDDYIPGNPYLHGLDMNDESIGPDRYRDDIFVTNQIQRMVDQISNYDSDQ